MSKKACYAIRRGHEIGIVSTWTECQKLTKGFAGAEFKKFMKRDEATTWIAEGTRNSTVAQASVKQGKKRKRSTKQVEEAKADSHTQYRDLASTFEPDAMVAFTDGCARPTNPGFGGSAAVLLVRSKGKTLSTVPLTRSLGSNCTNNRAELTAIELVLAHVLELDTSSETSIEDTKETAHPNLEILTDSTYSIGCLRPGKPRVTKN